MTRFSGLEHERGVAIALVLGAASVAMGGEEFAFAEPVEYDSGAQVFDVAVGDFNGNGFIDIATVDRGGGELWVHWNDGSGAFPTNSRYATSSSPRTVEAVDLNNNGRLDLVVATQTHSIVEVFSNTGDGFERTQMIHVPEQLMDLAAADLDGDGWPDVVAVSIFTSAVAILENNEGTLSFKEAFPAGGGWPTNVAIEDFSGDGAADILLTPDFEPLAVIHLNDGDGSFGSSVAFNATNPGPKQIATGDFDDSGRMDFVVKSADTYIIYRNTGPGAEFTRQVIPSFDITPTSFAVADLNGNGLLDLAIGPNFTSGVTDIKIDPGFPGTSFRSALDLAFLGQSQGVIDASDLAVLLVSWGGAPSNGGADLNGDGVVDGRDIALLLAKWGPIRGPDFVYIPLTGGARALAAADLDNDGDIDLVTVGDGPMAVIENLLR